MSTSRDINSMSEDTGIGVLAEVNSLLRPGWVAIREIKRIRVVPPTGSAQTPGFADVLKSEVWRIAQFVAYNDFVSIERDQVGNFTVISRICNGGCFQIWFASSRE